MWRNDNDPNSRGEAKSEASLWQSWRVRGRRSLAITTILDNVYDQQREHGRGGTANVSHSLVFTQLRVGVGWGWGYRAFIMSVQKDTVVFTIQQINPALREKYMFAYRGPFRSSFASLHRPNCLSVHEACPRSVANVSPIPDNSPC